MTSTKRTKIVCTMGPSTESDDVLREMILAGMNVARLMSVFRPHLPIVATSPSWETLRRSCFYWGVEAIKSTEQWSLTETLYDALIQARKKGAVQVGDLVVLTAGDAQTSPRLGYYTTSTNMCMVAQVQ